MKRFFKWTGFVVAGLVGLLLLATAYLYVASQSEINHHFEVATPAALVLPTDAAEIAEGERLAHIGGCIACHGENLQGQVPLEIPHVARFVAPNLTASLRNYTDAQLITLFRKGVKPDGTGVYFMPSEMFQHLRDQDLARVIAFLRSKPLVDGITGKTDIYVLGRFIVWSGDYQSGARQIAASPADPSPVDMNDPMSRGRYLTMTACSECHGQQLQGRPDVPAPALLVAKSYSPENFARLLHEGIGQGDRELGLMTESSRARFSHFTAEEVQAIYAFLQARQ